MRKEIKYAFTYPKILLRSVPIKFKSMKDCLMLKSYPKKLFSTKIIKMKNTSPSANIQIPKENGIMLLHKFMIVINPD